MATGLLGLIALAALAITFGSRLLDGDDVAAGPGDADVVEAEASRPSQVREPVTPAPVAAIPNPHEAMREKARQLAAQEDWPAALEAWKELLMVAPQDSAAHLGVGEAFEKLGRPRKAWMAYQHAIELNPHAIEGHRRLAQLSARGQRWGDAARHFEKVAATQPENATSHFNLGLALAKDEKWQRAVASLRRAVELQPAFPAAEEHLRQGDAALAKAAQVRASAKKNGQTRGPIEELDGGFVGSGACRDCHQRNYDTWSATYHRTMTQAADARIAMTSFDEVDVTHEGTIYRLHQHDGELWIENRGKKAGPADAEDTPMAHEPTDPEWRKVAVTTGSHHMQAYWMTSGKGRALELFPMVYLKTERQWVPFTSIFLVPPSVSGVAQAGQWNYICSRCHNTQARPRKLDDGYPDTHVSEFGISCESCHGPGAKHLTVAESGGDNLAIVNPNALAPQPASQVCGQCHSSSGHIDEDDREEWIQHGFSYRPGDDLEEHRRLVRTGEGQFWHDGMIRVSGREYNGLINSPCHAHGDTANQMSCMSCHQMHQSEGDDRPAEAWANDLLKPAMDSNRPGLQNNQACTQCHEEYADEQTLTRHTHHQATSSGSQCYNCHMPHTTWGVRKAMRSHTISSPNVRESLKPVGRANACNLCHMDQTLAWTAEHLHQRYGQDVPELSEDQRSVSAVVLDALQGDAGQRALAAWTMGWKPAQKVSGTAWLPPYLSQLMGDQYDVVRSTADRSLRSLDGFEKIKYDYMSPVRQRQQATAKLFERWKQAGAEERSSNARVLIDDSGQLQWDRFRRLFQSRDRRPMSLLE